MSSLVSYISSSYISAANALNGKKRRRVIAYVESYDDVFFWRSILSELESPELRFQVMLPSRGRKLERGKKAVFMSAFHDSVGPDMIACVDADYDFLRQGSNDMSKTVCTHPYVFHTYAYAIENLQCWAPSLHDVCVMVALNDRADIFDFIGFLDHYSRIIYPLFVWSVLAARDASRIDFDMSAFLRQIETGIVTKRFAQDTLRRVEEKVEKKCHQLESAASTKTREHYIQLKAELTSLGIRPQDTYLYIQGHFLFDSIVAPMIASECKYLVSVREDEIRRLSKHQTQSKNEISCYEHSIADIPSMLKKNTRYLKSPQVLAVLDDLRRQIL